MTDQPPTEPTPTPEHQTAPAPPAAPAAPPPGPPWAPPPATSGPARTKASGSPIRASVAIVAVLALLGVVGAIVWDGGSSDTAGPAGPTSPTGSGGQLPIPGTAGSSGGSSSSGSPGGGASPRATTAPLDPTDLGPSGAAMAPTEPETLLQWRLQGNWMDQITTYRSSFPAAGYELYRDEGARTTNEAGDAVAIAYEVVPIGAGTAESVGYLQFEPDPDDPAGSTYLTWRTEL